MKITIEPEPKRSLPPRYPWIGTYYNDKGEFRCTVLFVAPMYGMLVGGSLWNTAIGQMSSNIDESGYKPANVAITLANG
jgi:hypothetical protein